MIQNWEDYLMLIMAVLSGVLTALPPGTPWYVPIILGALIKALKDINDGRKKPPP